MPTDQVLTFDRYRLDLTNFQLRRGKRVLELPNQAFAVLRYLVEHAGHVVSKTELFTALWPGTTVSDSALTYCIVELRKALGDTAKQPKFIETVHRRGYRFIAPLRSSPLVLDSSYQVSGVLAEERQEAHETWNVKRETLLVGRETDLTQLQRLLEKALRGERHFVFVTGEPGIGKTTFVDAFIEGVRNWELGSASSPPQPLEPKSQFPNPRLWVAQGQCIEHSGPGEPYMPLLEALTRLCRAPEGKRIVPVLQRYAPTWLVQMPSLLNTTKLKTLQRTTQGATRERMLREMGEAIEAITAERPLVLVLEDLHWSDASTVELLSLLARRRETARLLVIATYRPVEAIVQEHPLRKVKQELQLHNLCEELSLGLLSEAHVAEYLEARLHTRPPHPGHLPSGEIGQQTVGLVAKLARALHQRTDGNPLFMVTAVDDLVSQGVLVSDDNQGSRSNEITVVTTRVPDTVQQLIEQQLERLNTEDRHLLEVASVAGMEFSAAAVAAGAEIELENAEVRCAGFAHHARFLRASNVAEWPDGTVAARYSFLHALYREVLYQRIPAGRRQRLHRRIGERQEAAYGKQTGEIAAELAVHFEQGHDYGKAVQYLQQAGENAVRRSANVEAITHLTTALVLLNTLPDTRERMQQEITLQLALGVALQATKGFTTAEVEQTYIRARELSHLLGETSQLFPALWGLWSFYLVRGEFEMALKLGEQLLTVAQSAQDAAFLLQAHYSLGVSLWALGKFPHAREHLEHSLALYDFQQHRQLAFRYGAFDPKVGALSFMALVVWALGYPNQALTSSQEALILAQDLSHPSSHAQVLIWAAWLHQYRREGQETRDRAEAAIALSTDQGLALWLAMATVFQGTALAEQGREEEGITQMRRSIAMQQAIGTDNGLSLWRALLADAYRKMGHIEEGVAVLTEAFAFVDKAGERHHEAELYRLKGELTLQKEARGWRFETSPPSPQASSLKPLVSSGAEREAEECFLKAIEIAQRQQAKSWELRASTSLARLWQSQGKKTEAHKLLSEIYNWFTEGFDTKDLQEARALLQDLGEKVKRENGERIKDKG